MRAAAPAAHAELVAAPLQERLHQPARGGVCAGRTVENSRTGSMPSTSAVASVPSSQLAVERQRREERHAVAGLDGRLRRLLEPHLHRDPQVARTHAGTPQLVLDHACARRRPACITISGSATSSSRPMVRPGEPVAGGHGEHDPVLQERLVDQRAVRPVAPTTPSSSSRSSTRSITVTVTSTRSVTATAGAGLAEPAQQRRQDVLAEPGARPDHQLAGQLAVLVCQLALALVAQRQQPAGVAERRPRRARVSRARRPERSISGAPTSRSSAWICWLTAGWLMPSASAAAEKEPRSATAASVSSWRISMISSAYSNR